MNIKNRLARAARKAKANRMARWAHGVARGRHHSPKGVRVVAHGAGSINAEADMQRLIREGRDKEAIALYELHGRIRGTSRLRWGHAWYVQQKAVG